jgi:hypothetical protein
MRLPDEEMPQRPVAACCQGSGKPSDLFARAPRMKGNKEKTSFKQGKQFLWLSNKDRTRGGKSGTKNGVGDGYPNTDKSTKVFMNHPGGK